MMSLSPEPLGRRIERSDADYPSAFLNLAQPPKSIWALGAMATAIAPAVAIVGTRHATPYGIRAARAIASACARAGVCVVSGLARGIDGAAHEGALEAGGRTVAVLGTSLEVAYPRTHRALQNRIANEGLVLTEMNPGEPAQPFTFPRRNRLIAALSQLVVVVEAGAKSGAMITVEHAQELNIGIAAVPGYMDAPQSYNTNRLLRDGVHFISEPDDVLTLLKVDASPLAQPLLTGDDAQLWDALTQGSAEITLLARRSGMTTRNAAACVSSLEIAGLVHVDLLGVVHATVCAAR